MWRRSFGSRARWRGGTGRLALVGLLWAIAWPREALAESVNFNRDWSFARGVHDGAEAPAFDDSAWQTLRLPHDWAIAGPYEPHGDPHTGKLPWRGEGWYRKRFAVPASYASKRVYLDFDGAMAMPTVYVNGERAGGWDYGYVSFRVDATPHLRPGQDNVVAVHLDTRPHHSRWYPGAGLYRKVRMVVSDPVHVGHWGTVVTQEQLTSAEARVEVRTTLENHRAQPAVVDLETRLVDPSGRPVATRRSSVSLPARSDRDGKHDFLIAAPERWDVAAPKLYTAVSRVIERGKTLDTLDTRFGLRTFRFTADDGFHLNGRRVQLHGVNLHHDHGPLGAVFLPRAMQRQLEIMRDMGVNAVRTSHNPPAPELLDLCDRMGLLVFDEVFDKWDGTATLPGGVSIAEHGKRQISAVVRRDRNHPSVVLWSVGNEVWDLEGGKLDNGPALLGKLVGFVKALDRTRPVTLAHAIPNSANTPLDDAIDVGSWNYARRYARSRETRPRLPLVYSESASAYSTRGYYDFPHPEEKDDYPTTLRISSYDRNSAPYSDIADTEFALMERDRFVAGEFVWTGFDYLGEPVPYIAEGWGAFKARKIADVDESRSSSFGIVDLVGIPKDRYYLYRSHWAPDKTTVHLLPHWNWPRRVGKNVPVYVYTNGTSAELFLNGRSLGKRAKQPRAKNVLDRYRLRWEGVRYEPGTLRAVAYWGGRRLGEAVVRTAGKPTRLRLRPDRRQLRSDGDDLSYVLVEALDRSGNLNPLAMNEVRFELAGPGRIAGVGNGDHHFPDEFDDDRVTLFYGKAMLIVRADEGGGGHIRVVARSRGLRSAITTLESR